MPKASRNTNNLKPPPSVWATDEQAEFLSSHLEEYRAIYNGPKPKKFDKFWAQLKENWFRDNPELAVLFPDRSLEDLSAEQLEQLALAIQTRITQLKAWYRWRCNPGAYVGGRRGRKKTTSLLDGVKPTRVLKQVEMYSKLYYQDKIQPRVEQIIKESVELDEDSNTKASLALIKKVTQDTFQAETDEVKREIAEKVAAMAKSMEDAEDEVKDRTPEHYVRALEELPTYLQAQLESLVRSTGWSFTVMMGGPHPLAKGEISSASFHVGKTPLGSDFGTTINFEDIYMKPYTAFLGTVYPPSVREARSIDVARKATDDTSDSDDDDTGGDNNGEEAPADVQPGTVSSSGPRLETLAPSPAAPASKPTPTTTSPTSQAVVPSSATHNLSLPPVLQSAIAENAAQAPLPPALAPIPGSTPPAPALAPIPGPTLLAPALAPITGPAPLAPFPEPIPQATSCPNTYVHPPVPLSSPAALRPSAPGARIFPVSDTAFASENVMLEAFMNATSGYQTDNRDATSWNSGVTPMSMDADQDLGSGAVYHTDALADQSFNSFDSNNPTFSFNFYDFDVGSQLEERPSGDFDQLPVDYLGNCIYPPALPSTDYPPAPPSTNHLPAPSSTDDIICNFLASQAFSGAEFNQAHMIQPPVGPQTALPPLPTVNQAQLTQSPPPIPLSTNTEPSQGSGKRSVHFNLNLAPDFTQMFGDASVASVSTALTRPPIVSTSPDSSVLPVHAPIASTSPKSSVPPVHPAVVSTSSDSSVPPVHAPVADPVTPPGSSQLAPPSNPFPPAALLLPTASHRTLPLSDVTQDLDTRDARRSGRTVVPSKRMDMMNDIGSARPKSLAPSNSATGDLGKENLAPNQAPTWAIFAKGHLLTRDLGKDWESCVELWFDLEAKLGFGEVPGTKSALPSTSSRPSEWASWTLKSRDGLRKYDAIPFISDSAEFGIAVTKWWHAMQPAFRKSENAFPIASYIAPDGSDWDPLRKAGSNGLISVLTLVVWWGRALHDRTQYQMDSSEDWKTIVDDISHCLRAISATTDATKITGTKKRKAVTVGKENGPKAKRART